MAGENFGMPGPEAFTAFWSDFLAKVAPPGASMPGGDYAEKMRKAFFESWSRCLDDYMRSDAFLQMMKQSTDHALAWQQQMNEYLQRGLSAAQMPSKEDANHIVMLVRGMEERVMAKLDDLNRRITNLEKGDKGTK